MRYEVKVVPFGSGRIIREVDIVNETRPGLPDIRETITRQIIDTMEAGTRKALEQLGWTAPGGPATLNLAPPLGVENPLGQERRVNAAYVLELERAFREAKSALMSIRI